MTPRIPFSALVCESHELARAICRRHGTVTMRMRIGQFINTRSVSRRYTHHSFLTRCVFVQFSSDSILLQAAVCLSYSFASKYNWHNESFSYSAAGGLMFSAKSVASIFHRP
jgi:hypothetical protein